MKPNKTMKLEFVYTVESEVQRVKNTISKSKWFKGFNYRLFFPDGFNLDSKNFTNLDLQVEKELNPRKMTKIEKKITDYWAKSIEDIDIFLKSAPYNVPKSLIIVLTQYGVGGSYWLPNKIIINTSYSSSDYYHFETLMHELVHLLIEKPVIQKNKLSHESKEALIDYIMTNNQYLKKVFPDYRIQKTFKDSLPDKKFLNKLNWI